MDVHEHYRLSNFTLKYKFKQRNVAFIVEELLLKKKQWVVDAIVAHHFLSTTICCGLLCAYNTQRSISKPWKNNDPAKRVIFMTSLIICYGKSWIQKICRMENNTSVVILRVKKHEMREEASGKTRQINHEHSEQHSKWYVLSFDKNYTQRTLIICALIFWIH